MLNVKSALIGLKADNRQKDLDLSKDYVTEWRTYIAEPLQREVSELRSEVAQLRHAIQAIEACCNKQIYFRLFFAKLFRHFSHCFCDSSVLVYT